MDIELACEWFIKQTKTLTYKQYKQHPLIANSINLGRYPNYHRIVQNPIVINFCTFLNDNNVDFYVDHTATVIRYNMHGSVTNIEYMVYIETEDYFRLALQCIDFENMKYE